MQIILASASQNRREIFDLAQIKVQVMPADVDEKSITETDLPKRAIAIARLKADAIAQQFKDSEDKPIVIAGDGFNECDGAIFEKPRDTAEAKTMLQALSNNKTTFHSGLVMYNLKTNAKYETAVKTEYWFRALTATEIDDYIKSVNVLQYSAAYSPLNTKAITFGKKIVGSMTGFSHSMPMDIVIPKLREWGALT